MKQLHLEGYKLVIFTNQLGVSKGKTKIEHLKKKMETITQEMEV
jgi:bifunctional polynucleotide phosphatase/kinase